MPGHRPPLWGAVPGTPAAEEDPSLTYTHEGGWEEDPQRALGSQRERGPATQPSILPPPRLFWECALTQPPSGTAIPSSTRGRVARSADSSIPYHPGFPSFP